MDLKSLITAFVIKRENSASLSTWCTERCKLAMIGDRDFNVQFVWIFISVSLFPLRVERVFASPDLGFIQGTCSFLHARQAACHLGCSFLYLLLYFNANTFRQAPCWKCGLEFILGFFCQFHFWKRTCMRVLKLGLLIVSFKLSNFLLQAQFNYIVVYKARPPEQNSKVCCHERTI